MKKFFRIPTTKELLASLFCVLAIIFISQIISNQTGNYQPIIFAKIYISITAILLLILLCLDLYSKEYNYKIILLKYFIYIIGISILLFLPVLIVKTIANCEFWLVFECTTIFWCIIPKIKETEKS